MNHHCWGVISQQCILMVCRVPRSCGVFLHAVANYRGGRLLALIKILYNNCFVHTLINQKINQPCYQVPTEDTTLATLTLLSKTSQKEEKKSTQHSVACATVHMKQANVPAVPGIRNKGVNVMHASPVLGILLLSGDKAINKWRQQGALTGGGGFREGRSSPGQGVVGESVKNMSYSIGQHFKVLRMTPWGIFGSVPAPFHSEPALPPPALL